LVRDVQAGNTTLGNPQVSRSGRTVVSPWGAGNGVIVVRDVPSGKDRRLTWKDRNPFNAAISPDDRLLATATLSNGEIALWNLADGQLLRTLSRGKSFPQGLAFSPSSKSLAAIHGGEGGLSASLVLWDCETGEPRTVLEMKSAANAVAFSPDETLIAVSEMGNAVHIWNLRHNRLESDCRGAGLAAHQLAFSPDGRRLATAGTTASELSLLKLWDTASGREVFSAVLPPQRMSALALSPDGHRLAAAFSPIDDFGTTGKVPSEIHIWDATPADAEPVAAAPAKDDAAQLQGTWIVTSAELNGAIAKSSEGDKFTFEGDKVTIENKVKKASPVVFRLDSAKQPKEIDVEEQPVMRGIYELNDHELRLCYGETRPDNFDSKQGLLLVLKRESP
jgi:uncharacterized protein (TIGR03067 family)